jgi:hypothetical protein
MARKIKYDLFLSHNRVQKDWVRDVAKQLRKLGLQVFFDEDTVRPGEPIVTSLERGLMSSRRVLLILSPSSVKSRWVAMERIVTQTEDPNALKSKLIPVQLEPVTRQRIPAAVRALNIIDLTDPATRDERYAFLLGHLGVPQNRIPVPPPWPRSRKVSKRIGSKKAVKKTSFSKRKQHTKAAARGVDGKTMILIKGDHTINDFYIDEYPVTNAEYRQFLEKENRRKPRTWKQGRYPLGKSDHPVTGVGYYEAKGYAQNMNKRLPTEKEWERAAVASRNWGYPWGKKFDKSKCNTIESMISETTPVTQYPSGASPYGVKDMVGNVWEWVDTWAREGEKKVKGGSYKYDQYAARVTNSENHGISSGRPYDVGFRCVMEIG